MPKYLIAERIFEIKNKYPYLEKLCRDYLYNGDEPADCTVEVDDKEIAAENNGEIEGFPLPILESVAVYRKIQAFLFEEDCFLIHCAVISYKGKAYAFTAKSGTGKTTHIRLWKKRFGDEVSVVNGDKPIIRRQKNEDGSYSFIAYGTPWCGKEHYNTNRAVPLGGLFLLKRGEENRVELDKDGEAVPFLLGQMNYKNDVKYLGRMLDFLDSLITTIPVWRLYCNMDISAAETAERAVSEKYEL